MKRILIKHRVCLQLNFFIDHKEFDMSLISKLYKHPLHNTAHYKPYVARYHESDFSIADHYRHLQQILPIYRILEQKVTHPDFVYTIPEHLSFATLRSDEIEKDIQFMESRFPHLTKLNTTLPATDTYTQSLNKLNPSNPDDHETLLAHYLIRILGDLFGGKGLKTGVTDALKRASTYDDQQATAGIQFYTFPDKALQEMTKWVNGLKLDNEVQDQIAEIATDAYQKHIDIFDELEATRSKQKGYSVASNQASFFNCSSATKIAVGGALTLVAGFAVAAAAARFGM
jgi:heme oxygenase